ncbi:MAG: hypothetical protein HQM16_05780 [Deltaproteobacteria bacterium]|nr:hypothetical protein [Deltaproteobacteria bacterium]
MAEVKGKFITLAASLMSLYKETRVEADKPLFAATGKHWNELDPEGWYDATLFSAFMEKYAEASPTKDQAIVTLGKNVYPTIKKTAGLPAEIKTPLDLIVFEAVGFQLNHRGSDVRKRVFIKKENGHVIVQAPAPGYSQKLYEGVFLGILEMFGIKNGQVIMTKGAPEFEYEITW